MLSKIRLSGLVLIALAIGLPASALADTKVWVSTPEHHIARIPVTGCSSEGDNGFSPPPDPSEKIIEIDAKLAHRVAFYKAATSPTVLAPQGWYCFGIYGANGSTLYISPDYFRKEDLFATGGGFNGPVVEASEADGDTPGRFDVARIIARVFPAHAAFARKVINEGVEPAKNFPLGPYPSDDVIHRNDEMVEFRTPPETDGLGTMSKLRKNKHPIDGVIVLTGLLSDKMLRATVRLAPEDKDITPAIIQQFEKDSTAEPTGN